MNAKTQRDKATKKQIKKAIRENELIKQEQRLDYKKYEFCSKCCTVHNIFEACNNE